MGTVLGDRLTLVGDGRILGGHCARGPARFEQTFSDSLEGIVLGDRLALDSFS